MRTHKLPQKAGWALVLLALGAGICQAQFSGSIQGVIQDPSGAVLPNATVRLSNSNTNVSSETKSNTEGNYRFVSLAPGAYQITVEATGFNRTTVKFQL